MGQPELLPAPFTRSFKSKEKADTKYVNTYLEDPDFLAFQEQANKPEVAPVSILIQIFTICFVIVVCFYVGVESGGADDESCVPRHRFPSQSSCHIGGPDGSGHGKAYAAKSSLAISAREGTVSSPWRRKSACRKSDRHFDQSEQCEPDCQVHPCMSNEHTLSCRVIHPHT